MKTTETDCAAALLPDGRWACTVCGFQSKRPLTPGLTAATVSRPCRAYVKPLEPCRHLGTQELRRVLCDSCGGRKTQLKVFACAVLGECTIGRKVEGVACCAGCASYTPYPLGPR